MRNPTIAMNTKTQIKSITYCIPLLEELMKLCIRSKRSAGEVALERKAYF
jgi:hypothetical protein